MLVCVYRCVHVCQPLYSTAKTKLTENESKHKYERVCEERPKKYKQQHWQQKRSKELLLDNVQICEKVNAYEKKNGRTESWVLAL